MSTAATPQLCRVMEKADLDSFLKEAFGIQSNDFQAKELFDMAKDATAWSAVQRSLALDDTKAARLALALKEADKGKGKAPAGAPATPRKAEVSPAVRHRIEELVMAPVGKQTSVFGHDVNGQPLDIDGHVVQKPSSWGISMVGKAVPQARRGKSGGGLSSRPKEEQEQAKAKKMMKEELAILPSSTLRMSEPPKGWVWPEDIKRAYENRSQLPAFLNVGIKEPPEELVRLEEGADASGKRYMQFINLTDARKAKCRRRRTASTSSPGLAARRRSSPASRERGRSSTTRRSQPQMRRPSATSATGTRASRT